MSMPGRQASTSSFGGSCKTTMGMNEFVEILFSLSNTSMAERSSLVDNGSSGCVAAKPESVNQPAANNQTTDDFRPDQALGFLFAFSGLLERRTFLLGPEFVMWEVPNRRGRIL